MLLLSCPLVFYEPRSGGIRDVIFASEYGLTHDTLPELQRTVDTLNQFAGYAGTPGLWNVIALLPPARMLALLSNPPAALVGGSWQRELNTQYRDQLRQAVEQGDAILVNSFRRRGANLMASYPAPCYYSTDPPLRNLLGLLIRAPGLRFCATQTHKECPRKLARWTQVGKLLYDHGCRTPINRELIYKLPELAAYMIKRGECCQQIPSMEELFELFFHYRAVGVIDQADCQTLVNSVKRFFSRPSQLDEGYTSFLNTTLSIKLDGSVTDAFPDISCQASYEPSSFSEQFKAAAHSLAGCGIIADTKQLKKDMYWCAQYERARLRRLQWDDVLIVPYIVDEMRVDYGQPPRSWGSRLWAVLVGESNSPLRQDSDIDPFEQLTDDDLITQLTERFRQLDLSHSPKYPNYWWPYGTPQEPAYQVAQSLVDGGIQAAQEQVQRFYRRLLQYTDQKEQAVAEVYRQLEALQNSEACQQARADANTKKGETRVEQDAGQKPTVPYVTAEQTAAFDWLTELFSYAPDTTGKNYRELAQLAIDHYYRMPHPDQIGTARLGSGAATGSYSKSSMVLST